ncbi:MAG: 50S ribosomal protein L22 [Saprospiraceae bacterium]|jgi:large subunit ribosomal protein L22|nr:50S ribosomal protein L22 [Saprospiraceae bacterium]
MEAVAKLRNCPMSPRKMRLVVDNIRGKNVTDALNILKFTNKEAAIWLEKLVLSVISNWEIKSGLSADSYNLYLKTAFVDGGTMMKRFQPAPQGRAHKIRKRTNHVTIIVENRIKIAETESTSVEA